VLTETWLDRRRLTLEGYYIIQSRPCKYQGVAIALREAAFEHTAAPILQCLHSEQLIAYEVSLKGG